jgi:hypothetical protein
MTIAPTTTGRPSEIVIFQRVLGNGKRDLAPALARYILTLGFSDEDKARMHELAVRNQEGALAPEEKEELEGYARAGCLLGILQSRARKSLKRAGKNRPSRHPRG